MTSETDGIHDTGAAPAVDARLVDRVVKLLAMAEGSPNPHEAAAFSAKAAALVAAHRIDPERLRRSADDPLDVDEVPLGRGPYVRARLALLQAVSEAHGCRVVFRALRTGTVAYVAGFRSDLDTVGLLHASLHAQAAGRMATERRATGAATQRWRRSFLLGFAGTVADLFAESERRLRHDAASPGDDRLPILRDRERRVDDYVGERFGRVHRARRAAAPGADGYLAGAEAADRADLGRARLAEVRGLGRGS